MKGRTIYSIEQFNFLIEKIEQSKHANLDWNMDLREKKLFEQINSIIEIQMEWIRLNHFFLSQYKTFTKHVSEKKIHELDIQDFEKTLHETKEIQKKIVQILPLLKKFNDFLYAYYPEIIFSKKALMHSPGEWEIFQYTPEYLDFEKFEYLINDLNTLCTNIPFPIFLDEILTSWNNLVEIFEDLGEHYKSKKHFPDEEKKLESGFGTLIQYAIQMENKKIKNQLLNIKAAFEQEGVLFYTKEIDKNDKIKRSKIERCKILINIFAELNQILPVKFDPQSKAHLLKLKALLMSLGLNKIAHEIQILTTLLCHVDFIDPYLNIRHIKSFTSKKNGANVGYQIKTTENKTYTIKQGVELGNPLAEAFSSAFYKKIEEIEENQKYLDFNIKRPTPKWVIASAFLVIKDDIKPIESAGFDPTYYSHKQALLDLEEGYWHSGKKLDFPHILNQCQKQLYVASEWSSDDYSFEICKLFGFDKRPRMAGTFHKWMFDLLRELNIALDLGLEAVVYAATFSADFDLHTENFMLKINLSSVPKEQQSKARQAAEQLKELITSKIKLNMHSSNEEKFFYDSLFKLKEDKSYWDNITLLMKQLKSNQAEVYLHKIDNDRSFFRYANPEYKVNFKTHRTSPLYVTSDKKITTQPTLHITEITGATETGIDQVFLTEKGRYILYNNNIEKYLLILNEVANSFFKIIQEKVSLMHLNSTAEKKGAEFILLEAFYRHISEKKIDYPPELEIDTQLYNVRQSILKALKKGACYKLNNLHEQLYERILAKLKDAPKDLELLSVKQSLELLIFKDRCELLKYFWENIKTKSRQHYQKSQLKFFSNSRKKIIVDDLLKKMDDCYEKKSPDKTLAFSYILNFIELYPKSYLATLVKDKLNTYVMIPIEHSLFKDMHSYYSHLTPLPKPLP